MSQLLLERQDSAWGETALSAEGEAQLRADLGQLMVCFAKAVADASVYSTQHHLTVKVLDQFLAILEQLGAHYEELTVVASEDEDPRALVVEGVFEQPLPLVSCFKSVLAGEYLEQLQEYMTYNDLVSLSLRRRISREELLSFLQITTRQFTTSQIIDQQKVAAQRRRTKRLSGLLRKVQLAGIFTVSRAAVGGMGSGLPWRVRLALAYLQQTLREIPLLAATSGSGTRAASRSVLRRAVLPLQSPEVLVGLLLNCQRVNTAGTELEGAELSVELLPLLQRPQLVALCRGLLAPPASQAPPGGAEPDRQRRLGLLLRVLPALALVLDPDSLGIFRSLLEQGTLPLADLPPHVRATLDGADLAGAFLADPSARLRQVAGVQDAADFCTAASSAPLLVRALLDRQELRWALELARVIQGLATGNADEGVTQLARHALRAMSTTDQLDALVSAFARLAPEQRGDALDLARLLGIRAAGALQEMQRLQQEQQRSWSGRASSWLRGMIGRR